MNKYYIDLIIGKVTIQPALKGDSKGVKAFGLNMVVVADTLNEAKDLCVFDLEAVLESI